jgi:hypothetical protein
MILLFGLVMIICYFLAHLMILCTSLASFPFFSWLATSADSQATYIWHVVCNTTWLPLLPAFSVSFPVCLPVCLSTLVFLSWLAIACLAASGLDFLYLTSGPWIKLPAHAFLLYNFWLLFRYLLLGFCYVPSSDLVAPFWLASCILFQQTNVLTAFLFFRSWFLLKSHVQTRTLKSFISLLAFPLSDLSDQSWITPSLSLPEYCITSCLTFLYL